MTDTDTDTDTVCQRLDFFLSNTELEQHSAYLNH